LGAPGRLVKEQAARGLTSTDGWRENVGED